MWCEVQGAGEQKIERPARHATDTENERGYKGLATCKHVTGLNTMHRSKIGHQIRNSLSQAAGKFANWIQLTAATVWTTRAAGAGFVAACRARSAVYITPHAIQNCAEMSILVANMRIEHYIIKPKINLHWI